MTQTQSELSGQFTPDNTVRNTAPGIPAGLSLDTVMLNTVPGLRLPIPITARNDKYLAAEPGSGKGVGVVIPDLLTHPDSVFVTDPTADKGGQCDAGTA